MKPVGTMFGMLTAAVMLIALLFAPSLAEAHVDHHHHAQQTSVAPVPASDAQSGHHVVADKIGVAETPAPAAYDRIQSAPASHHAAQQLSARAESAADQAGGLDHCMVGCCVGTSCAGSSAVATMASPLLPPQAALKLGVSDTRPMASLPTDGPRRPPRSFT
jgi:hypothetical protein